VVRISFRIYSIEIATIFYSTPPLPCRLFGSGGGANYCKPKSFRAVLTTTFFSVIFKIHVAGNKIMDLEKGLYVLYISADIL
jgi:hypothetical protein